MLIHFRIFLQREAILASTKLFHEKGGQIFNILFANAHARAKGQKFLLGKSDSPGAGH